MWVIVHLFVGLAFGAALEAPFWLIVLAVLASHVVLDLIPHWDYTQSGHPVLYGWLDFTGALATLIVCFLVWHTPLAVLALGPISGAPDFDVLFFVIGKERGRKWFPSHWDSFPHGSCGRTAGMTLQFAIMAVSLLIVVLAR